MIKLRKFEFSDLNQVIEIEKVSFPKRQVYSRHRFERYFKEYPEEFIIAENKGKVVGYTICELKNDSAEIISLAVASTWRQKGIGKALTSFLINHFKESGIKEIFLHVRIKNKVAVSFYQKFGFKILKTIKNYYQNGGDAYLMKLSLHLNPRSASPRSGI